MEIRIDGIVFSWFDTVFFPQQKKNFGKYVPLGTGFLFDSSTYLLRALNIFRLSAFGERFDRNRIREKEPQ